MRNEVKYFGLPHISTLEINNVPKCHYCDIQLRRRVVRIKTYGLRLAAQRVADKAIQNAKAWCEVEIAKDGRTLKFLHVWDGAFDGVVRSDDDRIAGFCSNICLQKFGEELFEQGHRRELLSPATGRLAASYTISAKPVEEPEIDLVEESEQSLAVTQEMLSRYEDCVERLTKLVFELVLLPFVKSRGWRYQVLPYRHGWRMGPLTQPPEDWSKTAYGGPGVRIPSKDFELIEVLRWLQTPVPMVGKESAVLGEKLESFDPEEEL